ncbi:MAG: hypothetical protein WCD79_10360 [Chthoniobacteraceae bacterium]
MPDDEPARQVRRKKRYSPFTWAVFLLLLTGFALASWMGSFYVFAHPEDPRCYKILEALNKVEPLKRFDVTAAPVGRFYSAKELHDSFLTISSPALELKNGELLRDYLQNYADKKTLVPYISGRFKALGVYELKDSDMFPGGIVAVAQSTDDPEVMIEQVYTTQASNIPKVRRMIAVNPDIILAKTFDLSAVVHAEKLEDGKFLFTVMPLGYGSYAFKQGISSTFRLDPPRNLNLEASLPLVKPDAMQASIKMLAQYRKTKGMLAQIKTPAFPDPTPQAVTRSSGPAITPPPVVESTEVQSIVVESTPAPEPVVAATTPAPQAMPTPEQTVAEERPVPQPQVVMNPSQPGAVITPLPQALETTPPSAVTPVIAAHPAPVKVIAKSAPVPVPAIPRPIAHVSPSPTLAHIIAAMHTPAPVPKAKAPVYVNASPSPARALAAIQYQPQTGQTLTPAQSQFLATQNGVKLEPFTPARQSQPVQSIQSVPPVQQPVAHAAWHTYQPGQMPRGKFLDWQNASELADVGINSDHYYIGGKYIVTAAYDNRVVLRPQGYAGEPLSTVRVVVEFPAGTHLPAEGTPVARGQMRPFQVVDVHRGNDGQVNVYAREITAPWAVTNTADLLRSYHQQRERLANQYMQ